MKIFKRFVVLWMVIFMAVGMFGCKGNETQSGGGNSAKTQFSALSYTKAQAVTDMESYKNEVSVDGKKNNAPVENGIVLCPYYILKVNGKDEYLYRVTYDPFNPGRLYISGQTFAGEIFSRIYIPSENELIELMADGVPAYKAAFWKADCYYAQRLENGFEDRRIVKAERIRRTRLSDDLVSVEIESTKRTVPDRDEEFE